MDCHFSETLKIIKKTLKVNNQELAALLSVNPRTVGLWLKGYQLPLYKRLAYVEQLKKLIREVS